MSARPFNSGETLEGGCLCPTSAKRRQWCRAAMTTRKTYERLARKRFKGKHHPGVLLEIPTSLFGMVVDGRRTADNLTYRCPGGDREKIGQ